MKLRTRSPFPFASALPPVLLCSVLAGCGGPDREAALAQIAALVPADAVAFVQLGSIDELEDQVRELELAFGGSGDEADIDQWLEPAFPLIGDPARIDRRRPIAVALSIAGGVPSPVAIVPAHDPTDYVSALPPRPVEPVVADGYVVVVLGTAYTRPAEAPAITADLPAGLLSARVNVAEVVRPFRPMLEGMLVSAEQMVGAQLADQPPGIDLQQMTKLYLDLARGLLDSADTVELSASLEGGELVVDGSLQALAGSGMDGWADDAPARLGSLAGRLYPDDALRVVTSGNFAALVERMEPFYEQLALAYPAEMRGAFAVREWLPLYELLGPGFAGGFRLSDRGLEGAAYLESTSPERVLELWREASAGFIAEAVRVSETEESELDGARLQELRIDFDMDAYLEGLGLAEVATERQEMDQLMRRMVGDGGMRVRVLHEGQQLAVVLGGDEAAAERALRGMREPPGEPPRAVRAALDLLGGASPAFLYDVDMAGLLRLLEDVPASGVEPPPYRIDPEASAPMLFYGGISGREWRGGFRFDLDGLAQALQVR